METEKNLKIMNFKRSVNSSSHGGLLCLFFSQFRVSFIPPPKARIYSLCVTRCSAVIDRVNNVLILSGEVVRTSGHWYFCILIRFFRGISTPKSENGGGGLLLGSPLSNFEIQSTFISSLIIDFLVVHQATVTSLEMGEKGQRNKIECQPYFTSYKVLT